MVRMQLFDTLSRSLKEVKPIDGKEYRFYCCGPTVYGPAHIGNFRTFVLQDVFRRTVENSGLKTKHVRNLTDVDDKTIRDSQAIGKSLVEFTSFWRDKFHVDCEALNCLPPHIEPSAIEHIPQQIAMIEELIEKDHAYASSDGSVYFKIGSFENYGKLSRLDTRELDLGKTQNERANSDEYEKDSIADFVLWKSRRPEDGENFWQSSWGEGRPGWHLECSAMIREYLGEDFDLHGGGEDLIFPHHENEIAQSKCSCGGDFAAHWFHSMHLLVDGAKMAKSKGNLYTLEQLAERGWSANEVRYVLISAHYRKQLNFTFESLHAAREALMKLAEADELLREKADLRDVDFVYSDVKQSEGMSDAWSRLTMDLNTPGALGAIFKRLKKVKSFDAAEAELVWTGLHFILTSLGLSLPSLEKVETIVPEDVQELAAKRWEAKQSRNWDESDKLRLQLEELGWEIKDGKDDYEILPK